MPLAELAPLVQTDQRTSSHSEKLPSFHLPDPRALAGSYHIDADGIASRIKRPENAGFRQYLPLNGCRVDAPATYRTMKFLDEAKVYIRSGDGSSSCVAFRRESIGGPSGGNGGRGGDVIIGRSD